MNKTKFVWLIVLSVGFIVFQLQIFAQAPGGPPASPATSPAQLSVAPQPGEPTYQGSVPQGTASPTPISLTLADAINRGFKANLGLLTSEQSSRQTRAE